jgi:hypothetical protein
MRVLQVYIQAPARLRQLPGAASCGLQGRAEAGKQEGNQLLQVEGPGEI